ncbi:MAG: CoA transferase [Sphingobium sp.]
MTGVLTGLKVLDLSSGIAGPMTTMLLGDHGAAVTRILPPAGDPFEAMPGYKVWQRGKDAITLDLKSTQDHARFLDMVADADILVESFSPGVTNRLGIDHDRLAALNPGLIYASITGYGRDTADAGRKGYDALVAARTGLHWEQRGWPDGCEFRNAGVEGFAPDIVPPYEWVQGPKRPGPVFPASFWPSLGAFFSLSTGINAALRVKELTGVGQLVETSLLQGALASGWAVWQKVADPHADGFATWVFGSRSPKGHFQCSDGKWVDQWSPNPRFIMGASEDKSASDLSLLDDPNRISLATEELIVLLEYQETLMERVKRRDSDFWVTAAAEANVPLQVCRPTGEGLIDPSFLAEGCVVELDHPELGPIRQVGDVYRLSACPTAIGASRQESEPRPQRRDLAPLPRRPLEGVRVLDFGLAVAGPYGTQILSDLGAEVIKVSAFRDAYWHTTSISYSCNRGKQSFVVDLKNPRSREVIERLVASADIVQHNMRYSACKRLGIDYDSLKAINPALIYCHTRGFEKGMREDMPGNDQTGAALAGIQYADGAIGAGGTPLWSLTSFGDSGNGFLSAIAMVQALIHRDRTGEGQFVDTSIVNAALLNTSYLYAHPDGTTPDFPELDRNLFGLTALYGLYETADGWLCVAALDEEDWSALCRGLERADLLDDPRFVTAAERRTHDGALRETLSEILKARSATDWMVSLEREGAPCEISDPAYSLAMFDDPELLGRDWITDFPHDLVGRIGQPGLCVDLSRTPGKPQGPPLVFADSTASILADLGYCADEIAALIRDRAVIAADAPAAVTTLAD